MVTADIVIVGAGVIGSAIAYMLARATRLRVLVIERGTPGCEASNAAAGVLAVASGQARRGVLFELRRTSATMFPELVAALEDETGITLGYSRSGLVSVALSEQEASELRDLVHQRRGQGFDCEMLDSGELHALEPAVNEDACAAALFRDDAAINSERLVAALDAAARRRGVQFRVGERVCSLSGGQSSVTLHSDGGVFAAGAAIVAAGAWSAEVLASCGIKVPLRPARGEMVAVRPLRWSLQHTVTSGESYLVPRGNDTVFIGSTVSYVGFDKAVTETGVATLLSGASRIVRQPWTVVRTWAGLRPCPTIRRPIIAPLPGLERIILATGHHRNGILLAPITAKLVTEMITGAAPSLPLAPFSYRRH